MEQPRTHDLLLIHYHLSEFLKASDLLKLLSTCAYFHQARFEILSLSRFVIPLKATPAQLDRILPLIQHISFHNKME
ncbi:hypothetical protein HDU98_004807, partial [Podochytrium sp. JEL0797]